MEKRRRADSPRIEDLPLEIVEKIVSYCPRDFAVVSKYFCKVVRSLRIELDVSKAKRLLVDDKTILKTIFSCHNIRKLDVSGWVKWDDKAVKYLSKLMQSACFKNLNSINMRNCNHISNQSLHILLPSIGKNLLELDLFNCKHVNYKVFKTHHRNLKTLMMGYAKNSDSSADNTSGVLEHFFGTDSSSTSNILFPIMEKLQLYRFIGITNLSPLLNIANTLKYLDIRGCTSIEPDQFEIISKLRLLEELHIGMPVENSIILKILESCKNISVLDLSESQISQEVVTSLVNNLKNLCRLKLSSCKTITNEWLNLILSSLNQLTVIDVGHCWRLTNSLFDSLSTIASGPLLSKIGVYMCSLDTSKLMYKFNLAGANNVVAIIHDEVQIQI